MSTTAAGPREDPWPGPRIDCPLCDWHLDATPPDVGIYTLGDVFGLGVMQAIATNEFLQKTERELQKHLSSHSLVEWVRKVAEQQREIERLTAAAESAKAARR